MKIKMTTFFGTLGGILLVLVAWVVFVGQEGCVPEQPIQEIASNNSNQSNLFVNNLGIRINEIVPENTKGEYAWLELYNMGKNPVNIKGYQLTNRQGNAYTIPDLLPDVPANAFVLIIFDGREGITPNDYDFNDNKAILHTPSRLKDFFKVNGDQCALYTGSIHSSETIIDFVMWRKEEIAPGGLEGGEIEGNNNEVLVNAINAKIWKAESYVNTALLTPGGSIGLYPEKDNNRPDDWVIYRKIETTPGAKNAVPAPYWRSPQSGAATTDHQIPFGWTYVKNAESYWLQVDNDPNFGLPEIDIQLPEEVYKPKVPLADDTYYWRVKAIDETSAESAWSEVAEIKIFTP